MKRKIIFSILALMVGISLTIFLPQQVTINSSGILSLTYSEVRAATERLAPTGQVTWTNLDGSYLDIDDDPDSADGNWGDPLDNNRDTIAHISFDTPTGNPTIGADLQEIRIWVKKWDGSGDPDVTISIYESGVLVLEILAATPVTSTSGELFSATWNANILGDATGASVEVYVHGKKTGGAPSTRATVAVGAIEWNVDYSACSPNISNTPISKAYGIALENASTWSSGSVPVFPLDDGECYFTVTNNSGGSIDINISATNFTGGVGWTLADTVGENVVVMKAGKSGDANEDAMVTLTTGSQLFIDSLADTASKKWEVKLETGTFTDGAEKTSTITLTAVCE